MDEQRRPSVASGLYDETIFASADIVDGRRVLLHAEVPHVERVRVRGRLALVTRHAVTVRKTIDVDVTHEELRIEYVAGDGTEMVETTSETYSVLLHAEEIEIIKRVRVVEEVLISKRAVVESRPATLTLAHENLSIVDDASA